MTTTANKLKVRPLGDRVLLRSVESSQKTASGIILPGLAKEKKEVAEVVAVGSGKRTQDGKQITMPVNVGDQVLFEKYSSQDIKVEGEEYMIVKAADIIAIVS